MLAGHAGAVAAGDTGAEAMLFGPTGEEGAREREDRQEHIGLCREAIRRNYQQTVLLLQGGGALGSYQAGVYDMLEEAEIGVDWVAGISIGAINCALIAGNPPEKRLERLKAFWERVSSAVEWPWIPPGDDARAFYNTVASLATLSAGAPGFFRPRMPPPQLQPPGSQAATSYYDTAPLRRTLEEFVDFDLLNDGPVRLSVGAVNVRSGNFVYFDTTERRIRPEHIMASGALPPGFPAVEIEGELYWDGGLVSNTPLRHVFDNLPTGDTLIFQVDLFSARGPRPRTLRDVDEREKDIRFSSRTRLNTDLFVTLQALRHNIGALLDGLSEEQRALDAVKWLDEFRKFGRMNIVHLIYRRRLYDQSIKDYEFSRNTMRDHWQAGYDVMRRTLRHEEWFEPPDPRTGFAIHDVNEDATD